MSWRTCVSLEDRLNFVVQAMHEKIRNQSGAESIPTVDYGWDNYRYASPLFRQAHVEKYFQDGMMVVHTTCFPHSDSTAPIFGFDVVAAAKSEKILGYFLDWSPITTDENWHDTNWEGERILPEWATVFSKQFIALRPIKEDYCDLLNYAISSFSNYLYMLEHTEKVFELDVQESIVAKQNEYCRKQSQNPRTFAALKHKIGEEKTRFFMKNVLFPQIS